MRKTAARPEGAFAELVRRLRAALSDGTRPISQQRLSELLGVSWSTVARWESGQTPDPMIREKLERLWQVVGLLNELVRPEDRLGFLEQRHPLLLRMRPIDLLATKEGFEAVYSLLEATASGAFA
jgi:uncharacterized protein (DUF2384 family)